MSTPRRLRIQIYADVLRAIHAIARNGEPLSLYRIERLSGLTYNRLKATLHELQDNGLLDDGELITEKGYAFLQDVSNKVAPVLQQYGLWNGHF